VGCSTACDEAQVMGTVAPLATCSCCGFCVLRQHPAAAYPVMTSWSMSTCGHPTRTDRTWQGMTARARRDNLRQTWVPTGDALRALERDSGVVIRFIIGRTCAGHHQELHAIAAFSLCLESDVRSRALRGVTARSYAHQGFTMLPNPSLMACSAKPYPSERPRLLTPRAQYVSHPNSSQPPAAQRASASAPNPKPNSYGL